MRAKTKLIFSLLTTAIWLTGACGSVYATTFNFSYSFPIDSGGNATASGTITGDLVSGEDYYLITAITGTRTYLATTEDITGLIAPNGFPNGFHTNDNLLFFHNTLLLDYGGISFTVAGLGDDGSGDVNVFYDPYNGGYSEDSELVGVGNFNVSPEPSAIILFGIGLACIGVRKFRA